jgi:threonine/homoserine/homoserine lactone efflux protein
MLEVAGVALLPDWPVFLSFVAAGLALNIVPGADMTFIIASAARGGRRAGVIASLGVGTGALVHILAAVLGLSAILASSQTAFDAIKYAGAAYLLWLAVSLLRTRAPPAQSGARPPDPGWRLFRAAMLVNILNPKVALFFLAFLPQFVDPAAAVPAAQILCLGLWFDFAGTLVNIAVALAAAGAAARLRHVAWLGKAARWIAATAMGALAVQLALSARRQA